MKTTSARHPVLRAASRASALTAFCVAAFCVVAFVASALLATPGCSSAPKRVDVAGDITADDWRVFAEEISGRMFQNGILDRYRDQFGRPPVLAIGDFQNNTTKLSFSRTKNFLYNEVQKVMVNSGKATINRDIAGVGGTRESLLDRIGDLKASPDYDPGTYTTGRANIPDLVLFGDINADDITAGRTTQFDYQVRVELIDTETRDAKWIETVNLTKLWKRPIF